MNAASDIDYQLNHNNAYSLGSTATKFKGYKSNTFMGARSDFESVIPDIDDRLMRVYGINGNDQGLGLHQSPFLLRVRQTYHDLFKQMPEDYDRCMTILEGITTTLATIRTLDSVSPFRGIDKHNSVLKTMQLSKAEEKNVKGGATSLVQCEASFFKRLNEERSHNRKAPLTPWGESNMTDIVNDKCVETMRMYPNGRSENMGFHCLRRMPDTNTLALIGWSVDEHPGLSDMLAGSVLLKAQQERRYKVENALSIIS